MWWDGICRDRPEPGRARKRSCVASRFSVTVGALATKREQHAHPLPPKRQDVVAFWQPSTPLSSLPGSLASGNLLCPTVGESLCRERLSQALPRAAPPWLAKGVRPCSCSPVV